jgi:hypothetical protein
MGGVKINGVLKGKSQIDCDMGGIELNLNQPKDSLSLDIQTNLGASYINGVNARGRYTAPNPEGELELAADMGSVSVNFRG